MKQLITLFLLLCVFLVKSQYTFNSTYYIENDIKYEAYNTIYFDSDNKSVSHTNGFDVPNYPLKLRSFKDQEQPMIITLEPDVRPDNYDSNLYKNYGYRGFQIYVENGKIIGVVEIIKSYYSKNIKVIKYL